jgi:hypothetical protein
MRPIDGDRLKAILNDSEKMLKSANNSNLESLDDDDKAFWKIYVYAIGMAFGITRNAIDMMPTLETREMNQE